MSIIKSTLEDHIAIVTINRPEAYNAMNPDVIESLENQINELKKTLNIENKALVKKFKNLVEIRKEIAQKLGRK